MNGYIFLVFFSFNGFVKVEKFFDWGILDVKIEVNVLRIENWDLVRMKRKLEE